MAKKILYQTLENRDNPDDVENWGPFPCKWPNTWLGTGYYYWDTFITNAHWWGNHRYKGKHIICTCECDYNTEKCFDLVGTTEHLVDFDECVELMRSKNLLNRKTTVGRVIAHMKDTLKIFHYEAVRVYGINSVSPIQENDNFLFRLNFEVGKIQYLDVKPAIQICIYKKNGLGLKNYSIIYPDEFNNDYLV
ncbi:hypothetical protein [Parasediminibacterium sp. JCM 36343]|uniref:hypothetical protein n=1 Tax=Parasediminibacterium sp. JCM 36343 TaxID=3374279 RepID=UPI00397D3640